LRPQCREAEEEGAPCASAQEDDPLARKYAGGAPAFEETGRQSPLETARAARAGLMERAPSNGLAAPVLRGGRPRGARLGCAELGKCLRSFLECELPPQKLVDRLGIGLARGCLHHLADEPAEHGGLGLARGNLVRVCRNHLIDDSCNFPLIGDLLEASSAD